jgi:pimeloyl-ACP methyl ester carboxylesterase
MATVLAPESDPPVDTTRARQPDATGFIERDGVRVFWERYGEGAPTLLLMPTWSLFHSRHWKFQIPYLARLFRVVTFDGRGNGRSDRPEESAAYADTEYVADALAVLEATDTHRAVVIGMSMGAATRSASPPSIPIAFYGAVFIGATIPILDRIPPRPRSKWTHPSRSLRPTTRSGHVLQRELLATRLPRVRGLVRRRESVHRAA